MRWTYSASGRHDEPGAIVASAQAKKAELIALLTQIALKVAQAALFL